VVSARTSRRIEQVQWDSQIIITRQVDIGHDRQHLVVRCARASGGLAMLPA
jgi:hypothetical protein